MKSLNVVISIVIVVAIVAAVSAYGIVNPDNNIFSLGYTPESGSSGSTDGSAGSADGVGTNNSNKGANNGSNRNTGAGVTGNGSGSNSGSGSGSNGGLGSNNGSGGSGSAPGGGMSANKVKSIVNGLEKEFGYHAGNPRWDSGAKLWVVPVLDKEGNKVDSMSVDPKNGQTGRY